MESHHREIALLAASLGYNNYLLSGFDHGYPVLCLGCTCMLPGNDLSQLGVREEVVTEPSEIRCQMKGLSYNNNNNNFDYNVIVMYMYTMECES